MSDDLDGFVRVDNDIEQTVEELKDELKQHDIMLNALTTNVDSGRRSSRSWRDFAILLLIIFIIVTVLSYIRNSEQRVLDNAARVENWTKIESGVDLNTEMITRIDEHLRQCASCHTHANHTIILQNWNK
jgi:hypothetical protein